MTAGRLVLWRHGQTDWNNTGRLQGHSDISLNDTGHRQAKVAASALTKLAPTQLYSSDLARAMQTARALSEVTGLVAQPEPGLREINVGEWSGLDGHQIAALEPRTKQWLQTGVDYRRSATGETGVELGERIAATLRRIAAAYQPADVLVLTTHGMAARIGAAFLLGMDFSAASRLSGLHNGAWLVLDHCTDGGWALEAYNLTAEPPQANVSR